MDLQAEKIELTKRLLETNNPSIIEAIKAIFKKSDSEDFWEDLNEAEKQEIEQGLKDIENGDTKNFDELISEFK